MKKNPPYALKIGDTVEAGRVVRKEHKSHKIERGAYKIVRVISDEQSTGFSYEAVGAAKGDEENHYFIKIPKLKPGVSDFETKNYLQEIYHAFSSEYQNRDRFEKNGNVAKAKDFGAYEFEDKKNKQNLIIPFLVQEYVAGDTLEEFLKNGHSREAGRPAIENAADFFRIAKEIVKSVKRIHNQQVIHGDIRPKNIRIQKGEIIRLVGFARSFMLDQAFHTRGGSLPSHPYRAPECINSNDYWYTPADIYSLGGVLYYLATGEDLPDATLDVKKMKEDVLKRFKNANKILFKQNEGIVKIIDKCLRYDPEERYPHVESILSALQTFDYTYQSHVDIPTLTSLLGEIKTKTSKIIKDKNTFFANIFHQKLSLLKEDLEAIENGHYEIYGDREDIIDSLVRYLSVLERGDQYLTVTKPAFWAPQNLGINGRFLTMNKVMATRGVVVRRVFLLTDDEANNDIKSKGHDPETYEILKAHQEATLDMERTHAIDTNTFTVPKSPTPAHKAPQAENSFYTGFRILPKEDISQYEKQVSHVALWRKTNGDQMSILFISRPIFKSPTKEGQPQTSLGRDRIVKVRFWNSRNRDQLLADIEEQLNKSTPISELWKNRSQKSRVT